MNAFFLYIANITKKGCDNMSRVTLKLDENIVLVTSYITS